MHLVTNKIEKMQHFLMFFTLKLNLHYNSGDHHYAVVCVGFMKIYLHRTQSKGLKVSETGTPHMHYRHTQSHTYFHAHTQCANCITEKPEAEGYKPPTAARLVCS